MSVQEKNIKTLGEMGVLIRIIRVKSKLEYQEMTCMLLGYAQNHSISTYHILDLDKKNIMPSRDII